MVIKVQDLRKEFNGTNALDGISFRVKKGEVFGLLGPNGAGKTTTVKIMSTMLLPDDGEVEIDGYDVVKQPQKVRAMVDIITARDKFYRRLTAYQNMSFFSRLYGVYDWKNKMEDYGERLGLEKKDYEKRLADYSTGMRQKLNLVRNLIRNTPILFLDEPTLGLDPVSSRKFRSLLKDIMDREEKTVIFTSHNMFEVEELCERIAILNKGRITSVGKPRELKRRIFPKRLVEFTMTGDDSLTLSDEAIDHIEKKGNKVRVYLEGGSRIHEVIEKIVKNVRVSDLSVKEPTLEEAFIRHTEEDEENQEDATSWM
ncbi:MAG: ABC transporter ATP-binding protein [Thermoplasmata archaeon]